MEFENFTEYGYQTATERKEREKSLVVRCYVPPTTENFEIKLSCTINIIRSLVDPASSHMLVSKIKPCMSQYMPH